MDNMRVHDSFFVTRYAIRNKLTDKPGLEWTKLFMEADTTLKQIVTAYKMSTFLKNIKFGVEAPQSTKHALQIDSNKDISQWREAMKTEINQLNVHETFIVLKDSQPNPTGYKRIPYHCMYDVKYDCRRKGRLVAGGDMKDPSRDDVFQELSACKLYRFVLL